MRCLTLNDPRLDPELSVANPILLPALIPASTTSLTQLTTAMGVPRDLLPSDAMIARTWDQLPRLLSEIPPQYRSEHHLRMCIAVANGLFDAAINYVWNCAILRLRDRIRAFGIHLVSSFIGKSFDEKTLLGLKDAELVDLCMRLNLISEDAFFFLDQCRDVRNNFSSAHPAMGDLDDLEVLSFLNRCTKHAMSDALDPRGLDLPALLNAVKGGRFTDEQKDEWVRRLRQTHDAQRGTAVATLHGIYCDPSSNEQDRLNALDICKELAAEFTPDTKSTLINRHSDYLAEGKEDRKQASRTFFQDLGLLGLLSDPERHTVFSKAVARLRSVHDGFDNFHNEPPFAEQLLTLSQQTAVPATAQKEFVEVVVQCAIGRSSGVSWAAEPSYQQIVRNFSPQEVVYMLAAPKTEPSVIRQRIADNPKCRARYIALLGLIEYATVPASAKADYDAWVSP